ncbi:MAG: hypothetical protein WCR16_03740 [Bacilli bacterium]|jgi:hypothetical protein
MDEQDLGKTMYETRTNLLCCANIIDYLWRRCDKNSNPFKPETAADIITKTLEQDVKTGKDILSVFNIDPKDIKASGIKKGTEYHFDICSFYTRSFSKAKVSEGMLALVYKPDRNLSSLFLIGEHAEGEKRKLKLLIRSKQKVGLFGSYQTEMVTFY